MLHRFRNSLKAEADRHRGGQDHHVPARPFHPGQHVDACRHHHSEHQDDAAAENRNRHRRDNRTDLRHKAADDQEDRADGDDTAAHDAGHRDNADILAEGCVRQAAEDTGDGRSETVGIGAAGQLLVGGLASGAALGDARDVTNRLDGADDRNQAHADNGCHVELDAIFERRRDGKPCRLANTAEIDSACGNANDIARDKSDQDRCRRCQSTCVELASQGHKDDDKCQSPTAEITPGRIVHLEIGSTTSSIFDTHRNQVQADGGNHHSRDQRWEPVPDASDNGAKRRVEQSSDNHRSHQRRHAGRLDDADHDRNKGKAGALHYRQPCADRAEADSLEQGSYTGEQHRHLDQEHHVGTAECKPCRAGDNNGRCDVACKHSKNMLKAQRYTWAHWKFVVRIAEPVRIKICIRAHLSPLMHS